MSVRIFDFVDVTFHDERRLTSLVTVTQLRKLHVQVKICTGCGGDNTLQLADFVRRSSWDQAETGRWRTVRVWAELQHVVSGGPWLSFSNEYNLSFSHALLIALTNWCQSISYSNLLKQQLWRPGVGWFNLLKSRSYRIAN